MKFRPEKDESTKDREAREAMEAVAADLRRAMTRAYADYQQPEAIEVPRHYPEKLVGAMMFRLPVRHADVDEPRIVSRPMFSPLLAGGVR